MPSTRCCPEKLTHRFISTQAVAVAESLELAPRDAAVAVAVHGLADAPDVGPREALRAAAPLERRPELLRRERCVADLCANS